MANFGPLTTEIGLPVWGTPANFNRFRVLAALLHGTLLVGVSEPVRRWIEGATYIRQGDHHVGPHSSLIIIRSSPLARRWPNGLELRCVVGTSTKFFRFRSNLVCGWTSTSDHTCAPVWSRPDLRSRSRSLWSCKNCTFLGLSTSPFSRGAQNWWLVVIVWDLVYMPVGAHFRISF